MNETVPWIRCCNVEWCDSTQVDEATFMRAVDAIGEVFGHTTSPAPASRGVALTGRCGVCDRLLREVH